MFLSQICDSDEGTFCGQVSMRIEKKGGAPASVVDFKGWRTGWFPACAFHSNVSTDSSNYPDGAKRSFRPAEDNDVRSEICFFQED